MKLRSGIPTLVAVDRRLAKPLHRQIFDGYREAILEGRLRAGDRLPSTRDLAAELGVSRLPVLEAFDQLLAEGFCESRVGSGTFVASDLPGTRRKAATGLVSVDRRRGRRLARGTAVLDRPPTPWLGPNGPFALGDAAFDEFPRAVWSRLLREQARRVERATLRYTDPKGWLPLREAIAHYLGAARAVTATAEEILIVSGSQQALWIAAHALVDPGDTVWLEEPGYWGAREAFRAVAAAIEPVPVDGEGIDVARGVTRAPRARVAYVTPSHQFPLGATMSASRRLQLLDWAHRAGGWILEDDYDSDFRYESTPVSSLHGLDRDSRVIYIGTFSKVLFGALRVGYMVVPPDLVSRFASVRRAMDICPPTATQAVLSEFLEQGHFARHLRRMRQVYRERRSALTAALESELGDEIEILGEAAGMHLAVLPRHRLRDTDRDIAFAAAATDLWILPLSDCYLGPRPRHGFVLGYAGATPSSLTTAAHKFANLLRS